LKPIRRTSIFTTNACRRFALLDQKAKYHNASASTILGLLRILT